MPGPKPKPTALKVLQGNPGHQTLPKNEPQPRPITPEIPEYLGEAGKRRWNELIPELEYMGTLTIVDGDVLGAYCLSYQKLVAAEAVLAESGPYSERGTGAPIRHPAAIEAESAAKMLHKFGAELGIGAASRSKVEARRQDAATEDPTAQAIAIATRRR